MTIYDEYEALKKQLHELKKENKELKAELDIARRLINSYYEENKHNVNEYLADRKEQELSDDAKRFVQDVAKGVE